jgi:hypothetical protein
MVKSVPDTGDQVEKKLLPVQRASVIRSRRAPSPGTTSTDAGVAPAMFDLYPQLPFAADDAN